MLAAADSNPLTDVVTWVNYGVLGLMVLGLLTGLLWPKHAVDRLIAEKEKAEAQRDAMALVLQEKLLPVVGDFILTTQTLLPILQDMHRQRLYGEPRDPPADRRRDRAD